MPEKRDFKELQRRIGYRFKDAELLENALMHTSYVNEQGFDKTMSNQRLEYLGDAVVELSVTNAIFAKLPDADEGVLSNLRAKLVCTSGLARVARNLGLGEYLVLGKGADKGRERENPTVLEDAFEALAGAIFLDGGWKKASTFVYNALEVSILNAMDGIGRDKGTWDRKTALQIELQRKGPVKISYRLRREEGPPHEKRFYVDVYLYDEILGSGSGYSKKEAEQDAAGHALEDLNVLKED
ncbi:MAG: ribonuclease III [Clostridiales Family XIII bacterium]|jgi:ribonuclease-3|nr:ribonuclease III [Clostridiales Family XIII bacterium]